MTIFDVIYFSGMGYLFCLAKGNGEYGWVIMSLIGFRIAMDYFNYRIDTNPNSPASHWFAGFRFTVYITALFMLEAIDPELTHMPFMIFLFTAYFAFAKWVFSLKHGNLLNRGVASIWAITDYMTLRGGM